MSVTREKADRARLGNPEPVAMNAARDRSVAAGWDFTLTTSMSSAAR